MSLGITVRLIIAYLLGLMAPGFPLSMYFGIRPYWCGAFALSWLSLVIGVISFQMVGLPITWGGLCAWQIVVLLAAIVAMRCGGRREYPMDLASIDSPHFTNLQRNVLLATIAVMGCVVAVRVAMSPLSGFDTVFRWEFLAKRMLTEANLNFYPPMSAEDYNIYVFPDGIAPLVSTVYWWLYVAVGLPEPTVTSGFVFMQWAVVIGFAWQLTANLAGRSAAWITASVLAGSAFLVRQVGIGQEAGALTISLVGMMSILSTTGLNHDRIAIAGGLLAGMGALSREYGGVFVVIGMLMQGWHWRSSKFLFTFIGVAAAVAGPWYLRNLIRCGNPFHSLSVFGFPPASPVLAGMIETYKAMFSLSALSWEQRQSVALDCVYTMPIILGLGTIAPIFSLRRAGYIAIAIVIIASLWHHSIGYTAGGLLFSVRVLTPAVVLAAVALGMLVARLVSNRTMAWGGTLMLMMAGLWGIAMSASFPFNLHPHQFNEVPRAFITPYPQEFAEQNLAHLVRTLEPANSRILTESAYSLSVMVEAGHAGVPMWSPEVSYLFDGVTTSKECQRRLKESGIHYLLFFPTSPDNLFCMKHAFFKDGLQLQVVSDHKIFALCLMCRKMPATTAFDRLRGLGCTVRSLPINN